MKKILIINTGGTIAMQVNKDNVNEIGDTNPLMKLSTSLLNNEIDLVSESFCNLPSPYITPEIMFNLSKRIEKAEKKENYSGVIVTHGTDTLEETAYFLDLVLDNQMPVVVTGAMRASNAIGADGIRNIKDSILTILSSDSLNKGVMVVMNDEINAARTVTKTNTTNVETFKSPLTGPLGIISNEKAFFINELIHNIPACHFDRLVDNVYVLTAYSGMNANLLNFLSEDNKTNGVVIEGLGAGNLPPNVLSSVENLLNKNIPVVLVSRCINGFAEPIYNGIAGGARLKRKGVIICRGLNGCKARIKLIVGLSMGKTKEKLDQFMNDSLS